MTLSGSRQQFLSGEVMDSEVTRYSRRGGCFVSHGQCAAIILAAIVFAVAVAALVYFLVPCRAHTQPKIDDLWNSDDYQGPKPANLRLPKSLVPSHYRINIIPHFDNYTFEGNVAITLSTKEEKVNKIILHSKGLGINEWALIEVIQKSTEMTKRIKRQANESTVVTEENVITTEAVTEATKQDTVANLTLATTQAPEIVTQINTTENIPTTEKTQTIETIPTTAAPKQEDKAITVPTDTFKEPTHTIELTMVTESRNIGIKSKTVDEASETITFLIEKSLKPNVDYILQINFTGKLDDSLSGFYRSSYKEGNATRDLGVTQFEPTSARKAFPCFDEPQMKAQFEISIARDKDRTALSNTPVVSEEQIDGTDLIWSHFRQTVPMSTYLIAYVVSDLRSEEAAYDSGVINATQKARIRVWSRPSLLGRTEYAATIAPKIVVYYEEYFDMPYVLEKMDLVAVPDFSNSAMENWGLITFRETALLVDPKESSTKMKQTVALDVAHEIAHQWFGNLVTMKWWTDLWLNEGFATYVEHIGVDKVEPSWRILDQFHLNKIMLMRTDALDSTHPVSMLVEDVEEINQKFDDISYSKGGILIRMLNYTLTERVFMKGVQNYLKKYKFSNAEKDDLWKSLTEVASKNNVLPGKLTVADLMDSWTLQPGFPVVQINRNYDNDTITMKQQIFTMPVSKFKDTNGLWYIPISYTSGEVPVDSWSANASVWMMKEKTKEVKLAVVANNTYLYANVFAIGYYRVNYDLENWRRLSNALHTDADTLPEIFKMQIVDDAFNLARVGLLNYSIVMNMSTYIAKRFEGYMPWVGLLSNLNYLDLVLETSPAYGYFQDYVLSLINKTLMDIGDIEKIGDSQQTILLRAEILAWACKMEHPQYIKWARNHFEAWQKQPNPILVNPIPKDSRSVIYDTVLRNGGRHEFNFLWKVFKESDDPEARTEIVGCLSSTRNIDLLNRLYQYALSDLELQLSIYVWDSEKSKTAFSTISKFVYQNWDRFYAKYNNTDGLMLSSIFGGIFSTITEQAELEEVKTFIRSHRRELKVASETLKKDIASAQNRIHWKKTNAKDLETWLINHATNN